MRINVHGFIRRAAIVLSTTLLGVVAASPDVGASVRDWTSRPLGEVAVVGDSLTAGYLGELSGRLVSAGFGGFELDAVVARRMTDASGPVNSGISAIRSIRAGGFDPPTWVIALGTNDFYLSTTAMEQRIKQVIDEIGPNRRVLWVNVWMPKSPADSDRFNAALERVAATRSTLTIADWASTSRWRPDWFISDGVHNSAEGSRARNAFLVAAVRELMSSIQPPVDPPTQPVPPEPVAVQPIGSPLGYVPTTPQRVVDTRRFGSTTFGPEEMRRIDLSATVPADARAAVVNLTAIGTGVGGFLTAWDCGSEPPTSSVNHPTVGPRAAAAVVSLDTERGFCLRSSASTEVLVDVFGAWTTSATAGLVVVPSQRLLDTRSWQRPDALLADEVVRITVPALPSSSPSGAPVAAATPKAALINLTVTGATSAGFVTAWPCGAAAPDVSSLNYGRGRDVANAAWVPVDSSGSICVAASTPTDLVVDVVGVLGDAPAAAKYQPVVPVRVIDTRSGIGGRLGRLGPTDRLGREYVPVASMTSLLETVTVTGATGPGFLTVGPCAGELPNVSTLNYATGDDIANTALIDVSVSGGACHALSGTSHLIVDVVGRFVSPVPAG